MKYTVTFFSRGSRGAEVEVEAKSFKQAAKEGSVKHWSGFDHMVIVSPKTLRRYTRQFKVITETPRYFKTTVENYDAILALIGRHAELFKYKKVDVRDKIFNEVMQLCILSTPAVSASPAPEQISTTAYSEETSVSKNTLTSKKTSNGSAMNAIWKVLQTPTPTGKSSGEGSAKGMVESTWSTGYNPFLSKPKPKTLIAKVKPFTRDIGDYGHPGVNPHMKAMEGKVIQVSPDYADMFTGEDWTWKKEWLDFEACKDYKTGTFVGAKPGEASLGLHYLAGMNPYVGGTYIFRKHSPGIYVGVDGKMPHYFVSQEWVEFDGEPKAGKGDYAMINPFLKGTPIVTTGGA